MIEQSVNVYSGDEEYEYELIVTKEKRAKEVSGAMITIIRYLDMHENYQSCLLFEIIEKAFIPIVQNHRLFRDYPDIPLLKSGDEDVNELINLLEKVPSWVHHFLFFCESLLENAIPRVYDLCSFHCEPSEGKELVGILAQFIVNTIVIDLNDNELTDFFPCNDDLMRQVLSSLFIFLMSQIHYLEL